MGKLGSLIRSVPGANHKHGFPHRTLKSVPHHIIRMVAGFAEVTGREEILVAAACNHPNCLVLPFSVELIRLAA
jgi:hypothetical protein